MIAEGGTEDYHAVTIARSRSIQGPYEGYAGNPILTHRHLGLDYPICNVGHGDLVQLQDGSWYMVMLGSRIYGGYHKNLGRETFIAPVDWKGEWPVVSPGTGRVEWRYPAPDLPACPFSPQDEGFGALCWNTLGTPQDGCVTVQGGVLTLRSDADWTVPDDLPHLPAPNGCPGFYGRRQQHMTFAAQVQVTPGETGEAGVMLLQHGFNHLRVSVRRTDTGLLVQSVMSEKCGRPDYLNPREYPRHVTVLGETVVPGESCCVGVSARGQQHQLTVNGRMLAEADGSFLGSETAGGFVGAYVGCYVSGEGAQASFADFRYRGE